jgi:nitrite reductase (NADH) large subunit
MNRNQTFSIYRRPSEKMGTMGGFKTRPRAGSKPLLIASVGVLMLVALIGVAGMSGSWPRFPEGADYLWRDGFRQQISGYALVTVCLLALGLSLRKRWKRCAWGRLSAWRLVHVLLGCLSLALLGLHTGFERGRNLNELLWLAFLSLILFGALTGIVAALEGRQGRTAVSRGRMILGGAHLLSFWVLAVVLFFHILTVYYF